MWGWLAGVCIVQISEGEYKTIAKALLSGCEHGLELCQKGNGRGCAWVAPLCSGGLSPELRGTCRSSGGMGRGWD